MEPIVIKGAGHANIVSQYASEVVDAATQGLQANDVLNTERHGQRGAVSDRGSVTQQLGAQWYTLTRAAISVLAALIVYFVIRPHVTSDTEALAIAWFIPVLWTLGSSLWLRRLDVLGLFVVVAYGITLALSNVFGAGALPLKLHRALLGGAVGLVCLGSVVIGRPIFLLFIRRSTKNTGRATQVETALADPWFVTRITNLTLLIGIACLADAASRPQ